MGAAVDNRKNDSVKETRQRTSEHPLPLLLSLRPLLRLILLLLRLFLLLSLRLRLRLRLRLERLLVQSTRDLGQVSWQGLSHQSWPSERKVPHLS